jgi:UDP-N-acetylmuramate dehydrogenase
MKTVDNTPLATYTSLHAGGAAERLIIVEVGDKLAEVIAEAQKHGPVTVLGGGTNCLISDKGLLGSVIVNTSGNFEITDGRLRADSGVDWDDVVAASVEAGLWGLECMSGIPGGVGGAIAGNIAAYGQKIADTLVEAQILNPADGSVTTWHKEDFAFGYRSSALQRPQNLNLVILEATFALSPQPTTELIYHSATKVAEELSLKTDDLANRRKIIMTCRERIGALLPSITTGPFTAGSFFKNPLVSPEQVDSLVANEEFGQTHDQIIQQNQIHGASAVRVSAAHILLAAGYSRGQTWGQVRLHPDHILKLENTGQATALDIYKVTQEILATVKNKLGITLEPEVRFLGDFS